jgi:hypothetical protein
MTLDAASIASAALWGGYVAWKELVPVLRRAGADGNGAAGNKSVDYWRLQMRDTVQESITVGLAPKFDMQIAILADMKNSIGDVSRGVSELVTLERSRLQGRRS